MKKIIYSVAIIGATFLAASCGDKKEEKKDGEKANEEKTETTDETTAGTPLEGDWEIKRATGDMASMNVGVVYSFKGDKLTFGTVSFKNQGTTVVTENTFTFQADGNDLKFSYQYKMEGDTLVVTMDGSNQTFYLVKK